MRRALTNTKGRHAISAVMGQQWSVRPSEGLLMQPGISQLIREDGLSQASQVLAD